MKKTVLNLLGLMTILALLFAGCNKDEDEDPKDDSKSLNPSDWKGDITSNVTLDAATTYKLTGQIFVKENGKLTIPAGTKIEAMGGTSAAIIVEMGGQIFINGTAAAPVVMTSGLADKSMGDWGGLVIAGRATCNSGGGSTEVGDVPYGGDKDDDNSGSITYLRIEYSGAAFNSEKEYNGLSFFGVGSGTTVEYVQIHECADDPIEFYGGTVHANYIVCSNGEDDMFDWTEGWNGGGENWFGIITREGLGNRGMECDNWSKDFAATPVANPTIKNVTLIGNNFGGNESQGLMLRAGTAGSIDNVVVTGFTTGIEVRSDESIANIADASLRVTNISIDVTGDELVVKNTAGDVVTSGNEAVYSVNASATGAGNGVNVPTWTQGWTVGLE